MNLQQLWKIQYTNAGRDGHEEMEWPEVPDREHAAQFLRDRLFDGRFIIPDTPRPETEPTVYQLRTLGITIVSIDLIEGATAREPLSAEVVAAREAEATRLRNEVPGAVVTVEPDGVWLELNGRRRRTFM